MNASKASFARWHFFLLFLSSCVLFSAAPVLFGQTAEHLLNLNLGSGTKVGQAAIGNGTNDSWNVIPAATNVAQTYTYYGTTNTVPIVTWGTTTNLVWATGSNTTLSVTITNLTEVSHNYTEDAMFDSYLGSDLWLVFEDWNEDLMEYITITADPKVVINGLPEGTYDLLVYGLGGNWDDNQGFSVQVGTNSPSSTKTTTWFDPLDVNWTEDYHYVKFTNLTVNAGNAVTVSLSANNNYYFLINGLQIIDPSSTNTTEQLPSVTFDPVSGTTVPTDVTLYVTNHTNATIYYTTDGSTPTTNSSVYSSAISLSAATTIKAFATKSGYTDSAVSSATYPLPQLPIVSFDPASGALLPTNVILMVSGHTNATIYYTLDGSTPTTSSTVYSGPISLGTNSWSYSASRVPTMTSYTNPSGNTVTYSSELSGSSRYAWKAFDHSVVSQDNNHWSANSAASEWVALEFPSARHIAAYALQCRANSGDGPKSWTFEGWNGSQYVTLDTRSNETNWYALERRAFVCTNSGSYIKYRLNISEGNASAINTNAYIVVGELEMFEAKATITAFATKTNYLDSIITFADYFAPASSIPQIAPTPNISPTSGDYGNDIQVTIDSSLSGASYKYSTDGTNWLDYTNAISVAQGTTLMAYTTKSGYTDSAIRTNSYTFTVALTTITPNGGNFTNSVEVTLTNTTGSATIQYSLNGSALTNYTGPLTLTQTTELAAVATKSGYASSTNTVTFTNMTPNIAPSLTVPGAQTVDEDTILFLSGVSASDADAGNGTLKLTLWATNGILVLGSTNGLTFLEGANGQTTNLVVEGVLSNLNAGLTAFGYLGLTNFNGSDVLTLIIDDQGNSGTGGPLQATNSISITVNAVNDPPRFTISHDVAVYEDFPTNATVTVIPDPIPADETGQTVTYSLSPTSVDFANVSINSTNGAITVTAVTNASGMQIFTITANDGQSTNNLATYLF